MKAVEGANYCQTCVGKLSRRTPEGFVLRYPASHDGDKGTCRGCGNEIALRGASKVVRREI